MSPLLLAATASFVLTIVALLEVARSVRRAEVVRRETAIAGARLAADAVAMERLASQSVDLHPTEIAGVQVTLEHGAAGWQIESRDREGDRFLFRCNLLSGAAPRAMGQRAVAVDPAVLPQLGGGMVVPRENLPVLDPHALAGAVRAAVVPILRRDQGIALLHWEAGTERDDYVFDHAQMRVAGCEVPGGLLVVPGHLWIEPSETPHEFVLPRDLVIVVQGNLYVGASLVVRGGGRLVFATSIDPQVSAFADHDGNGRWSSGDVLRAATTFIGPAEGGGSVYLGLPGSRGRIDFGASVVLTGELHLHVAARIAGPLVLPHGVTVTAAGAQLVAAGDWLFATERERVPGFCTSGEPRPGLLLLIENPRSPNHQPLYLSQVAR